MGGGNRGLIRGFGRVQGLSPRGRGKLILALVGIAWLWSIPAWAGETLWSSPRSKRPTVYPRVGGGNADESPAALAGGGLSPRGRGKRKRRFSRWLTDWSIPAWAGETLWSSPRSKRPTVYPRVGGGNDHYVQENAFSEGLSPRGRGKPGQPLSGQTPPGSIPAWAGEPIAALWTPTKSEVYPRVGGGTPPRKPRMTTCWGLSPRGRGKRPARPARRLSAGSIPAWAGETARSAPDTPAAWVYPRVGGGNAERGPAGDLRRGLSPRGRGKRRALWRRVGYEGSIPAWAGETRCCRTPATTPRVYPRVGGGNAASSTASVGYCGLSPRGRGKPGHAGTRRRYRRSIPAWAGETLGFLVAQEKVRVYPRVGGGNLRGLSFSGCCMGLSPRGRGKLELLLRGNPFFRSIPAWAGETELDRRASVKAAVYPRVGGGNSFLICFSRPINGLSPRGRGKRGQTEPATA